MRKKKIILIIISLLLIVVPFLINIYSIYKLISLALGILLLDISFTFNKKINIFLLIYLPLLLIIFTYAIDYMKTYTFDLSPIYVFENKINDKVSTYNSLFYRIYKCNDKYIFDNQYQKNYVCETDLLESIDINKLLNEPKESYKKYKNDFIKVSGKISKISGTSSILLQAYTKVDGSVNGYVKFNETSKLKVDLAGVDISKYKIYDYITVVGLLSDFDKDAQEMILTNVKIEETNLYNEYTYQIIESSNCSKKLEEYTDNFYTYCIENIYLDYKVDKYELSYVLKDKKINLNDLITNSKLEETGNYKLYKLEKFDILSCNKNKNILINKNSKVDYSLCEE
ncbi:MAG: hypothetical protein IJY87_00045 [Bacilli bacterium]|nr:hypothetical protein [Bacilli bacterium]